jgi:hypothetical protein
MIQSEGQHRDHAIVEQVRTVQDLDVLDKLRCCPWRAGKIAKAIQALLIHAV